MLHIEPIISANLLTANPERFLAAYRQDPRCFQGRNVSSGLMKESFPEYSALKEHCNRSNLPVHNAATVLAAAQFLAVIAGIPVPQRMNALGALETPGMFSPACFPRHVFPGMFSMKRRTYFLVSKSNPYGGTSKASGLQVIRHDRQRHFIPKAEAVASTNLAAMLPSIGSARSALQAHARVGGPSDQGARSHWRG